MSIVQYSSPHATIRFGDTIYIGPVENNKAKGKGAVFYDNGDVYYGEVQDNCTNGNGILFSPRTGVVVISRNFTASGVNGHGRVRFRNGELYDGNLLNGIPHHHGTLSYPDGSTLQAYWVDGLARGTPEFKARFISGDGSVRYVGSMHNGKPAGQGRLEHMEREFVGEFSSVGKLLNGVYSLGKRKLFKCMVDFNEEYFFMGPPKKLKQVQNLTIGMTGLRAFILKPGYKHFLPNPNEEIVDQKFVNIDPSNDIFKIIATQVEKGIGSWDANRFSVYKVLLNVNPSLKEFFDLNYSKQRSKWSSFAEIEQYETVMGLLWHGTKDVSEGDKVSSVQLSICREGPDVCMSGASTGTRHGHGFYAAAPFQSEYTIPEYCTKLSGQQERHAIGKYSLLGIFGQTGTMKPNPNRFFKTPFPDDSFIDTAGTHENDPWRMVVLRSKEQVYPAFVVFVEKHASMQIPVKLEFPEVLPPGSIPEVGHSEAETINRNDTKKFELDSIVWQMSNMDPPPRRPLVYTVRFPDPTVKPFQNIFTVDGNAYLRAKIIGPKGNSTGSVADRRRITASKDSADEQEDSTTLVDLTTPPRSPT